VFGEFLLIRRSNHILRKSIFNSRLAAKLLLERTVSVKVFENLLVSHENFRIFSFEDPLCVSAL
jgi:hypothetical protein